MTNEEIVKALRQCAKSDCSSCGLCPIFLDRECVEHLATAAANLIEQLIDENTELREEVNLRGNAVRTYEKKRAEAEAERDALREKRLWQPVLTGNPERKACYLVTVLHWLDGLPVVREAFWNGVDWLSCERRHEITPRVTHWMPLPEAPEKGEKA